MCDEALAEFIRENKEDLQVLGLLFLRLLRADTYVMDTKPSPVLQAVMTMSQAGVLTEKPVEELIRALNKTGENLLADGYGGSLLRL